jgi:hypothetical protein
MRRFGFCTFFDHRYLLKGLALYRSMRQHCPEQDLWIVCFDDISYTTLSKMSLPHLHLIRLSDFEDEELLAIKSSRSPAEYCFTCTPSVPLYVLGLEPKLEAVFYIDADMFFYSDPSPIWEEFTGHSIVIVGHRFSPKDAYKAQRHGIYNVGLAGFRRDENALECLTWWRQRCIEWCYARSTGDRFADQKYLDDWPVRFQNVVVAQHKGVGLAPWNMKNYAVTSRDGQIFVDDQPLVLYHFHTFRELGRLTFSLFSRDYSLRRGPVRLIYRPYVSAIRQAIEDVRSLDSGFPFPWYEGVSGWRRALRNSYLYPYLWRPLYPLRAPKFLLRLAARAVLSRLPAKPPGGVLARAAESFLARYYGLQRSWIYGRPHHPEWFDHRIDLHTWASRDDVSWVERGAFCTELMWPGCAVLDAACGDGFYSRYFFADIASRVDAIDRDPSAIAHAQKVNAHPKIHYHVCDMLSDPFPSDRYDFIVCNTILEHLSEQDRRLFLKKARDALGESGVLTGRWKHEPTSPWSHRELYSGQEHIKGLMGEFFSHVLVMERKRDSLVDVYFRCSCDESKLRPFT